MCDLKIPEVYAAVLKKDLDLNAKFSAYKNKIYKGKIESVASRVDAQTRSILARAKINNESDGFVKIIADEKTDKVLGVHMIGPHVGDMIAEMALAMEFGASAEDIARTCHAHPTHTEAIKEAALAIDKRPIHF